LGYPKIEIEAFLGRPTFPNVIAVMDKNPALNTNGFFSPCYVSDLFIQLEVSIEIKRLFKGK